MTASPYRLFFAVLLLGCAPVAFRAERPEVVLQSGHAGLIYQVAYAPDGRLVATAGGDNTIKLWEPATGRELRTINGHAGEVLSVAFSPDGRLASGSSDATIRLWNVTTGAELALFKGHIYGVNCVAFSPDGRTLASASSDKTVRLWDVSSGRELRVLNGHEESANAVAFSPDGRVLASAGWLGTVKLWDASTGRELRMLSGRLAAGKFIGHNPDDIVDTLAFSPDGHTLASGSWDKTARLWDVSSGRELRTLTHEGKVNGVAFSPDGHMLATGNDGDGIKFWDVATGRLLRELPGPSESVAFSPDGLQLANAEAVQLSLWDLQTGAWASSNRHVNTVYAVALSPDGRTLASARQDEVIKLWDTSSGNAPRTLAGHTGLVSAVAFSPDGKLLASGSYDKTIKLWDASSGRMLRTIERPGGFVDAVVFSPDGKLLATSGHGNTVELWDAHTGAALRVLHEHVPLPPGTDEYIGSLKFSPDGKTIAGGFKGEYTIHLWDVVSGAELRVLRDPQVTGKLNDIEAVAFSPDGKLLASGGYPHTVKLWDVATGALSREFAGPTDAVKTVAFSPDGRTLASGGYDNVVRLWDVGTGRELRTLAGHAQTVRSLVFSADGQLLISGSEDGTMKLWTPATGAELAAVIAIDQQDWLVLTPAGLFDGSPVAWAKLLWRFNHNTFDYGPAEAFFNDFFYPNLLADIFAGRRPAAPQELAQLDRRPPRVALKFSAQQSVLAPAPQQRTIALQLAVTDAPAGAQDVRLFRNGLLVRVWRGDVLRGQPQTLLETTVPLIAGPNNFTAYAFNRDNVKSPDAMLVVQGGEALKRLGTARVLTIGVDHYANAQYDLKYAVADARAFGAEVKRQLESLRRYDRVEVTSLFDQTATKANLLSALAALARTTQPEDTVIVYFAGHGTAQQNRFYLLPHDLGYTGSRTQIAAAGLQTILNHSVADRELEQAFEGVDAGQLVLVIDACNSGQALEAAEKRRGPMNSKGLAQLAYEKGMYILTAAQSFQAAQEASQLGHGLLTYALVEEGLKQTMADKEPQDGAITIGEWLDYATTRVPAMQLDKMQAARAVGLNLSFADDERGLDLPRRTGQHPRVFYRREFATQPFVVAQTAPQP